MQKKWIVTLSIIGVLLAGGVVAAQYGCHPGGFDEFDLAAVTGRIASRLELTEAQKTELDRLSGEILEKAKAMRAEGENHHQALADLVRQDDIDRIVVAQRIDEKMVRLREMADFVMERLIAFHGTLTPEQREKLATRIEAHATEGCRFGFR